MNPPSEIAYSWVWFVFHKAGVPLRKLICQMLTSRILSTKNHQSFEEVMAPCNPCRRPALKTVKLNDTQTIQSTNSQNRYAFSSKLLQFSCLFVCIKNLICPIPRHPCTGLPLRRGCQITPKTGQISFWTLLVPPISAIDWIGADIPSVRIV